MAISDFMMFDMSNVAPSLLYGLISSFKPLSIFFILSISDWYLKSQLYLGAVSELTIFSIFAFSEFPPMPLDVALVSLNRKFFLTFSSFLFFASDSPLSSSSKFSGGSLLGISGLLRLLLLLLLPHCSCAASGGYALSSAQFFSSPSTSFARSSSNSSGRLLSIPSMASSLLSTSTSRSPSPSSLF